MAGQHVFPLEDECPGHVGRFADDFGVHQVGKADAAGGDGSGNGYHVEHVHVVHLRLAAVHPEGDNQAQRAAVAGKAGVTRHFPSCVGLLDGENHFNEVVLVVGPVVKYAVAQSCAYQYAEEAIEEKAHIKRIVICEECLEAGDIEQKLLYEIAKYDCIYVSKKVFNFLTDVIAPQGILAVVEKPNPNTRIKYDQDIILVLDGIQDPGNLGTILRTADSVNLKQIIVTKNTADCYNPKVVRSTMGAIFRVGVIETDDLVKTLKEIKKNKRKQKNEKAEAKRRL